MSEGCHMPVVTLEELEKYYEVVPVTELPEGYPLFVFEGGVKACFIDDPDVNGIVLVAPVEATSG